MPKGAHASLMAVLDKLDHPNVRQWLNDSFTKVTVRVESEAESLSVYESARKNGLLCALVQDRGLPEFEGIPTYMVVALGPDANENLRPLTGHLPLY